MNPRIVTIYIEMVPNKIIAVRKGACRYGAWRDID
jgi:hypothetical protein